MNEVGELNVERKDAKALFAKLKNLLKNGEPGVRWAFCSGDRLISKLEIDSNDQARKACENSTTKDTSTLLKTYYESSYKDWSVDLKLEGDVVSSLIESYKRNKSTPIIAFRKDLDVIENDGQNVKTFWGINLAFLNETPIEPEFLRRNLKDQVIGTGERGVVNLNPNDESSSEAFLFPLKTTTFRANLEHTFQLNPGTLTSEKFNSITLFDLNDLRIKAFPMIKFRIS